MHVANCKQDLTDIEHGDIIAKPSIFPQTIKELSSRAVLKDHVNKDLVLECSLEAVDEWMIQFSEDAFLELDVIYLLEIYDVRLGYLL